MLTTSAFTAPTKGSDSWSGLCLHHNPANRTVGGWL